MPSSRDCQRKVFHRNSSKTSWNGLVFEPDESVRFGRKHITFSSVRRIDTLLLPKMNDVDTVHASRLPLPIASKTTIVRTDAVGAKKRTARMIANRTRSGFSREQNAIIDSLEKSTNLIVDAVAGSGKTTTIEGIVKRFPEKSILVLTYNTALCEDSAPRIIEARRASGSLAPVSVRTLHAFVFGNYSTHTHTDVLFEDVLKAEMRPKHPLAFDMIIADEFQDFNFLMIKMLCKIVKDNERAVQCVFLGDHYQTVYACRGADPRHLIYAQDILRNLLNPFPWTRKSLSTTYRLTDQCVAFMNNVVLGYQLFTPSGRAGRKPTYVYANAFESTFHEYILRVLKKGLVKPEDCFILAPSWKSDLAYNKKLANFLLAQGYNIHVRNSEEDIRVVGEELHKIAAATHHCSKGRGKPLVIVLNFDSSYFKFYAKDEDQSVVPPALYVALTRAEADLVMVHHVGNLHLPFLRQDLIPKYCIVKDLTDECKRCGVHHKANPCPKLKITDAPTSQRQQLISVTELVTHLDQETSGRVMRYIPFGCEIHGQRPEQEDLIPGSVRNKRGKHTITENVSAINGNVVTLLWEYECKGSLGLTKEFKKTYLGCGPRIKRLPLHVRKQLQEMEHDQMRFPEDFITIALILTLESTGISDKVLQVTDRNWVNEQHRAKVIATIESCFSRDCSFEVTIVDSEPVMSKLLAGRIDIIDHERRLIAEIKYTSCLADEHRMQLALYRYLIERNGWKVHGRDVSGYSYGLFNVQTGRFETMDPASTGDLGEVARLLIHRRFGIHIPSADEDFIAERRLGFEATFGN